MTFGFLSIQIDPKLDNTEKKVFFYGAKPEKRQLRRAAHCL